MPLIRIEFFGTDLGVNSVFFEKKMDDLVESEMDEFEKLFGKTVTGFSTKPKFDRKKDLTAFGVNGLIGTVGVLKGGGRNTIYSIINWGTASRPIKAKSPNRPMKFRPGYVPATSPGKLAGRKKRRHGPYISTTLVKSHSITARRFDLAIQKRRKGFYQRKARTAMKHVARNFWIPGAARQGGGSAPSFGIIVR